MIAPRLRTSAGALLPLDVSRWLSPAAPEDDEVLARAQPAVLDVGCGPGRHVLALVRRGRVALGIDPSPHAVAMAHRRGAPVLRRSVFERVPGAGRWGSALVLDGSIGIGGDPAALLRRVAGLLRPGGRILAELDEPGAGLQLLRVRVEAGPDRSHWFPWARLGTDALGPVADAAGLSCLDVWGVRQRWFCELRRE